MGLSMAVIPLISSPMPAAASNERVVARYTFDGAGGAEGAGTWDGLRLRAGNGGRLGTTGHGTGTWCGRRYPLPRRLALGLVYPGRRALTIAVDGRSRGTVPVPAGLSVTNATPLRIGGKGVGAGDDQYRGAVDDIFYSLL